MASIIGVALWALVPGFVAKKKGRNFWGWYFLSFIISPLITMIIVLCLSNLSDVKEVAIKSNDVDKICFCRKCGCELVNNSDFCSQCGTKIIKNMETKQDEVL